MPERDDPTEKPPSAPAGVVTRELQPRVLKEGSSFAVFNPYGDILASESGEDGLFHEDTRYLSRYELRINNSRPLLLSSAVGRDDSLLVIDLTNPDFGLPGKNPLPRERLHLSRRLFLWKSACYERLVIHNYSRERTSFLLQVIYDADFTDIFEVRGKRRPRRGQRLESQVERQRVVLAYRGLDEKVYSTCLWFKPAPDVLAPSFASYTLALEAGESTAISVVVGCDATSTSRPERNLTSAYRQAKRALRDRQADAARLYSSNELFNEWLNRSSADLNMLVSETPHGRYPYAGIPWFSTPFGRDGIIAALQCLWLHPALARGVLSYLAATQATEIDPEREAEPGKILHETRSGEMATLKEVPFARYYGSVDATPLFVVLAGAYFARTGDLESIEALWPSIESALGWIDGFGDLDGDGFVEYAQHSPTGLVNQGWKDSEDSVFHRDGQLAHGAIALCEVQAYVYAARRHAAGMAAALGQRVQAETLNTQAELLKDRFEASFWDEELGTYVLALDGEKRPCRVRSSNAGHALLCGIAAPARARVVSETLMSGSSFSRWGIRTLDARERRYNPMSYHNGSIWPHDNGLIALGFSRYDLKVPARKLLTGLFDASIFMDLHRLPELFCGFTRTRSSQGPVGYPTACAPQAWASATVFCLLEASLGVTFDPTTPLVRFHRPRLPGFLSEIQIRNLEVGGGSVDLVCRRHAHDVAINILKRRGSVEVVVTK